jgi:predicted hydrocarbon binding protein
MTDNAPDTQTFYLPNKIGRIFLLSYEEVIGQAAFIAVQKMAGLHYKIGTAFPNNLNREFCFNDLASINETLEKMYGPRAGRGLAIKSGQVSFKYGLQELGSPLGITNLTYRLLPLPRKIEHGLQTLIKIFNRYTNENVHLREDRESYFVEITHCPLCWQRTTETPCCHFAVGLFQEFLFWVSGGRNFLVKEIACIATGQPSCTFQIARHPLD